MQVFVKTLTGKTITLDDFDASDSVNQANDTQGEPVKEGMAHSSTTQQNYGECAVPSLTGSPCVSSA
jgi:hypothetical protein